MIEEIGQFKEIYDLIVAFFITYSFQLIGALIILAIGLLISNRVALLVSRTCEKHGLDVTLSRFLASCTKIIITVAVAIICLGKIGVSVTPFVAAIGALSLGAGLAVQGLLSNYGAGLNIILTRPFVVGDTITVQGVTGVVEEVRLAQTILTDEDEVAILVPNRHIVGEILHNSKNSKVVESKIGVAYTSDPDLVIATIRAVLQKLELDSGRPPQIGIDEFGDSGLVYGIRFWVPTNKYHHLRFRMNNDLFKALSDAGIEIPFPQREVRLLNTSGNQPLE